MATATTPGTGTTDILARMERVAAECIAPRATAYDQQAVFPKENFEDLEREGLLAAMVPTAWGGLGLDPKEDLHVLWSMTKTLARADMSFARCWEGHVNAQLLIAGMGSAAQQERWFTEMVTRGAVWAAWSGEPQTKTPGQATRVGTHVERVEGGWIVDGTKVFATSAPGADWAVLLVSTDGPGGVRHATGDASGHLLLACALKQPSVSFDGSWWDPIGMRATVSYLVRFDKTFIPDDCLLGAPGQYVRDGWQTRFAPQYGATFLGAAEAALDYALESVRVQGKDQDPYLQHRLARMAIQVETGNLWLAHVARLWAEGRAREASVAGVQARVTLEELATETVQSCIHACGARSLMKPSPLERIYRDLSIYVRHDSADHVLATLGRALLGRTHDLSFYRVDRNDGEDGTTKK